MPQPKVRIVNRHRSLTGLKNARKLVDRGQARWVDRDVSIFIIEDDGLPPPPPAVVHSPNLRINIGAQSVDSGVDGFLRYPMPMSVTTGPKFPALARAGAGL